MHFHFCLATMPQVFRESVQDTIMLIAAGLEDSGCRVTIDDARVIYDGSAINLILEHFDGDAANDIVATKKPKGGGFPFGLIFTEDLDDANVMSGDFAWRAENFRKVAESADFVWHYHPSAGQRPDIVDPAKCGKLDIGYSARFATIPMQPVRDIDFFLPGLVYPRRKPIIDRLHALGYHVRVSDLTTPAYIYRSLIGRAKAILDIRRFDDTTNLSLVRITLAATNGIATLTEKFDNADYSEFYRYAVPIEFDSYIERCIDFVERDDAIAVGAALRDKFIAERPFKPFIERPLVAPFFDAFRA